MGLGNGIRDWDWGLGLRLDIGYMIRNLVSGLGISDWDWRWDWDGIGDWFNHYDLF